VERLETASDEHPAIPNGLFPLPYEAEGLR
jgi:hypothetical protein